MNIPKIATISLGINTNDLNFGAILHNYAMLEFLNEHDLGHAEIIDYVPDRFVGFNPNAPFLFYFRKHMLRSFLTSIRTYSSFAKRYKRFEAFKTNYIPISKEKYLGTPSLTEKLDYDIIIAESDVIWSPKFFGGKFDPAFFMAVPAFDGMKKIAYAPSIADGNLTKQQSKEFQLLSKDIPYISARESYAIPLYERLSHRVPISQVLDPVFLVSPLKYTKMAEHSSISVNAKYVLVYLPVADNYSLVQKATEYARENDLEIIELSHHHSKRNHKVIFDAGPEEFLKLILHAEMIFTNSFHAVSFSLIFHRNFYAFSRSGGGKVLDVCKQFGLENRYFGDNVLHPQADIDYNYVQKLLDKKISSSRKWLTDAIQG